MTGLCAIVLNYKDAKRTKSVVEYLLKYDIIDTVLIVENGSCEDEEKHLLSSLNDNRLCYIEVETNEGYSKAMNKGIKFCMEMLQCKYIAIVSSDVFISQESLNKLYLTMESNVEIGLISPIMLNSEGKIDSDYAWHEMTFKDCFNFFSRLTRNKFKRYYTLDLENGPIQFVDTIRASFFFLRCETLEKSGLFDENLFLFYEECIICKKIRDCGYKVAVRVDETYVHNHLFKVSAVRPRFLATIKSGYYYLCNYLKINWFKKMLYKIGSFYEKIEFYLIVILKKVLRKNQKGANS